MNYKNLIYILKPPTSLLYSKNAYFQAIFIKYRISKD